MLFPFIGFSNQERNYEKNYEFYDYEIKKDGSSVLKVIIDYTVLTEKGRSDLSLYKVQYDNSNSRFNLKSAFSINGGVKTPVPISSIYYNSIKSTERSGLSNIGEAIIPFNNVVIGGKIFMEYQIQSQPYIDNIFSTIQTLAIDPNIKSQRYSFTSEIPLYFYEENLQPFYLATKQTSPKYSVNIFSIQNSLTFEDVNKIRPTIFLTTLKNWQELQSAIAKKYLTKMKDTLPKKLLPIIATAKTMNSPNEKIDYVSKEINKLIAYSGNWTTISGKMFPQDINNLLLSGKGDCKDFSTLLAFILKNLGFEAHPALTFRSQVYKGEIALKKYANIPNTNFFNHAIVWAKDQTGKVWWIDPTNPFVQADVITGDILGNFALILDGKSKEVTFLPKKNEKPAEFYLEQTLTISKDNTVIGTGNVKMNASPYNTLAMVERLYGNKTLKVFFGLMLNPYSRNTNLELKSTKLNYDFTYFASDWVKEEESQYKAITIFNPLGLSVQLVKRDDDGDLGEPGITKFITHIKNQKEIDTIDTSCLIRSKWLDVDRIVENKPDEITITDILNVKERFISKQETSHDFFKVLLGRISNCVENSNITLKLNEARKTIQEKEQDKLKGPPIENMTDADAIALDEISGPDLFSYASLKLFRYHNKKIQDKKSGSESYYAMARAIRSLGFIRGDLYIPEHITESLFYLDKALLNAKGEIEAKIYSLKILNLLTQNKEPDAIANLLILNGKHPKSLYTYKSGYRIALLQKKFDVAEKWIRAAEPLSKTNSEKGDYFQAMYDLYSKQNKFKEAISYQEKLIQLEPKNPWMLHNLAILYLDSGNFEKCIELEKKALSISEFGMAKKVISEALIAKALNIKHNNQQARTPASIDEFESLALEAIKYDKDNTDASLALSELYLQNFKKTNSKIEIQKGKPYLLLAIASKPTLPRVITLSNQYKQIEDKR